MADAAVDAGPSATGDGCLPGCILALRASCAGTVAQTCVTQTVSTGLIDSCFDNGVKLQQARPNATSSTIEVKKADGSICYRETVDNGNLALLDPTGTVVAEVMYRTSGDNLATCHDGTSMTFRSDSAACMAEAAKEPQCTSGSCSF